LREFNIDSTTHQLKNVTVKQEPQVRFNKQHPAQVPADVTTMVSFVNTNTADVEANTYSIPEIEAGKNFLAGKAHTLNSSTYHWNGSTVAGPEFITSDKARFNLSLNTCSGCHGGEANTGNFMHVAPGGLTGVPAFLSGFLKGNPPLSSGGFVVNDRALRPAAPGEAREFNDLERRKIDLESLVHCTCTPRFRPFDLVRALKVKTVEYDALILSSTCLIKRKAPIIGAFLLSISYYLSSYQASASMYDSTGSQYRSNFYRHVYCLLSQQRARIYFA
jgi:hypothetical protein